MGEKAKFYVVWVGRTPGIYTRWPDCLKQVHKFPGARYKGFTSRAEAERAFKAEAPSGGSRPTAGRGSPASSAGAPIQAALSVDGACSGNPGPMEYQAVWVGSRERLFRVGPMYGTNNLGEFLALVDALRHLSGIGDFETPIYTDSLTARAWVRNKKTNTTLPRLSTTEEVWWRVDDALNWLRGHTLKNPILTWNTRVWGEIPADFGRK